MKASHSMAILMADDDHDDCLLTKEAWADSHVANPLYFVHDGEELMDYLKRRGRYADPSLSPRPGVILLDLNMPKKDGREALMAIKADPELHLIPVVVLTTSSAEADIIKSYDLGASSFITKPVTFEAMIQALKSFQDYWIELVRLPRKAAED